MWLWRLYKRHFLHSKWAEGQFRRSSCKLKRALVMNNCFDQGFVVAEMIEQCSMVKGVIFTSLLLWHFNTLVNVSFFKWLLVQQIHFVLPIAAAIMFVLLQLLLINAKHLTSYSLEMRKLRRCNIFDWNEENCLCLSHSVHINEWK